MIKTYHNNVITTIIENNIKILTEKEEFRHFDADKSTNKQIKSASESK